jgi:fatty acid synthase
MFVLQVQFESLSELMPSQVLVQLPSQATRGSKPLFIVHPIEGVVTALKPVAAELPFPVWGLQCTPDAPLSTIQDLASFYVKVSCQTTLSLICNFVSFLSNDTVL